MLSSRADVTAIVLNYARFENVKVIVSHLCSEQLRDTISNVIVWNNNVGLPLSVADFDASLPEGMLRIINSPDNYYFQARFLACVEAPTHWCLVQDDDYLVSAEAIRALRVYAKLNQTDDHQYPIHLLPPHEHLSTTIRTRKTNKYTASFAWLGHGTLLTKTHARSFLNLLRTVSNNREDVMKMADNVFSIMLNRRAEIWIDPGKHFEAGQDRAFTVGAEGDERNWRYIKLAEEYLEHITSRPELVPDSGFSLTPNSPPDSEHITCAPVLAPGHIGVWSTNAPMLPAGALEAGLVGDDLRSTDRLCRAVMAEADFERYTLHNLACIGDGHTSTVFRSPAGCKEGQWLRFDFLNEGPISTITFRWTAGSDFAREIQRMSYEIFGGQNWIKQSPNKVETSGEDSFDIRLELERPSSLVAKQLDNAAIWFGEYLLFLLEPQRLNSLAPESGRNLKTKSHRGRVTNKHKVWLPGTKRVTKYDHQPTTFALDLSAYTSAMLGHYMPAAMMAGRDQMQQSPIHQQPQQQHLLSQQQHMQQQQHHNPQQPPGHPGAHNPQQGQQNQFGPQNGGGVGPPPPNGQDMSLASVLHYLQTEWRRYERERNEWEIERAEMRARIALLEGERRSFDNLKVDWTRRIKMLEYALKVERTKQVNQSATSAPSNKLASLRKEDDPAPLKEGSGSSSPRSEDIPLPGEARPGVPSIPGLPNSRPQSIAGINGLASQSSANPLAIKMTGRDPKSRARSKDYLKQCLQEVNYLTSPQAVNPLPNRPLVSLGPTSTLVGSNAQNMGQQDNQHQPQAGTQQPQSHPQHLSQHQPITVALPNLPPFPSITAMNEQNQQGGNTDTIGFNGRPRKLVPEVGKDFPVLNGGLEPSLMPASAGVSRDAPADSRDDKSGLDPAQQSSHESVDQSAPQDEEPLAPIPLDEPEPGHEERGSEPQPQASDALEEQELSNQTTQRDSGVGGMFSSDRNLVTAIFRPDDQGEWKRKLQEAHDEATRAGVGGTGLENITLKDEFDVDEVDSVGSTEEESEDKAKVWKTRKTLRNHLDAVRAVAFHPSEMCLASGGDDSTIKIWRLDPSSLTSNSRQIQQSIDVEPQLNLRGHTAPITCLVVSQRGLLFSASMDASIRIWAFPPESLQPYAPYDPSYFRGELVGHTDVVWGLALVRDGTWLASGGADGMIKVWEVSEQGGNLRLSWGYNGTEYQAPEGQQEEVVPVVAIEGIKSDLRKVAVAYANCVVKVFDIETGKELAKLSANETYDGTSETQINAIVSHPTMPILVTAHEDKYIRIFDITTGECQHSMLAHLDTVTTLSIDTTGFSLVSGSHDGSIRFWDILGSRTCVQEINAHREKSNEGTLDVEFHPSMPFIASAGADGVVKIYAS
ncbi:hypothetical protein FRC07_001604 [Ceratobasidium sp. 392]|nr:hypothetical protein FRC07_001604 [Ceratobasidium sp. 392]